MYNYIAIAGLTTALATNAEQLLTCLPSSNQVIQRLSAAFLQGSLSHFLVGCISCLSVVQLLEVGPPVAVLLIWTLKTSPVVSTPSPSQWCRHSLAKNQGQGYS